MRTLPSYPIHMPPHTPASANNRIAMIDAIEALLPQTQCGKCKHPGCRPYAEAMAAGESINHCVPGGQDTIDALGTLLGKPTLPLDPSYGQTPDSRQVAVIRESECIGCTKCIQACPVDAIVGAAKYTHTIIRSECTGCDLCIAPCPVDCIDLINLPEPLLTQPLQRQAQAAHQKRRYELRTTRLTKEKEERTAARRDGSVTAPSAPTATPATATGNPKSVIIAAALLRSNLKKTEARLATQPDSEERLKLEQEIIELRKKLSALNH
jgi:electron transport complex protein RnfB